MFIIILIILLCGFCIALWGICYKYFKIHQLWKLHFFSSDIHNNEEINREYLNFVNHHYDQTVENDLELLDVFQYINTTRCEIGREYMYGRMYMTPDHHDDLEMIITKIKDEKTLKKILYELYKLSKGYSQGLDLFRHINHFQIKDYLLLASLYIALIIIIALGLLVDFEYFFYLFFWLAADMAIYSHYQAKNFESVPKATSYCYVIEAMKAFERLHLFDNNQDVLPMIQKGLKYTLISRIVNKISFFDVFSLMEFVKGILMIPVLQYMLLYYHKQELENDYIQLYEWIGLIDMAITIADLRNHQDTCIPRESQNIKLSFENCYHPLIANVVKNSFSTEKSCMITGSNASGKSTFLKTIGINLIMAKAIHTCFADKFCYKDLPICTSIHIKDDLESGESYYVKEIKTLKSILEHVWKEPCYVFIDEILRGTNEKERIEISRVIMKELYQTQSLVFVTTHDLTLVDDFTNIPQYCFSDQIKNHQLYCDYKIKKGISKIGNAIELLYVYQYDERILKALKKFTVDD